MTTWHALELDGPVGTTPVVARLTDDPSATVLVVRDESGTVHATATGCPHLGQPLAHGEVEGGVIECGHHAYRYRLADGVCVGPGGSGGPLAGRLAVHDVREGPDGLEVRLRGPGGSNAGG